MSEEQFGVIAFLLSVNALLLLVIACKRKPASPPSLRSIEMLLREIRAELESGGGRRPGLAGFLVCSTGEPPHAYTLGTTSIGNNILDTPHGGV